MKQQSKRATFIDVGLAQEKILDYIDKCIDDNKPLDKKERKKFLRLFRMSTLGLGSDYPFLFNGKYKVYDLKHIAHAGGWLAYQDSSDVVLGNEIIEIKELWIKLRDYLLVVFPYADTLSTKISQEQIKIGTAISGKV